MANSQTNGYNGSGITEAKQVLAWLVLGWETSGEKLLLEVV